MYPRYSYPVQMLAGLVRDALLGRHRDFGEDARSCAARLSPPLHILGERNIPAGGCYVVTVNHYYRPGFASQWGPLSINSIIPGAHWIMASELTFPAHRWFTPLGMPLTRFALGRAARAYGFTSMPPMPPRARDVAARAGAVRSVLRYASATCDAIIALAPEGGDQPGGRLTAPPAGVGRFCLLLAEAGLQFLPVGIYEREGRLTLHFGEVYELRAKGTCPPAEKDRLAAHTVMSQIAGLLPPELRGGFAGEHVI